MTFGQHLNNDKVNSNNTNNSNINNLLNEKSCFVIDLDGVVYKGKQLISGANEAILKFRHSGKKIVFLTNNSADSVDQVLNKLIHLGVVCDRQEILTAAQASASFIAQHQIDRGRGLFIVGTEALKQEVITQGLSIADPDDCGAVLVGLDPDFDYTKINLALRAITRGASLVICNRDANFPVEDGHLKAGCGAMVGAIESASGRLADFEVGKPKTIMLDIIINKMQIDLNSCLIIGDMLASDILMANNAKIPSIWISKTSTYSNLSSDYPLPSFCMPSLEAISKFI